MAVMWDVDGTLADSEPLHRAAMVAALARFGVGASEEDEGLGLARRSVHERLEKMYDGVPPYEEYSDAVDDAYLGMLGDLRPISGAVDACKRYAGQGRAQVAVSNSEHTLVHETLGALGIAGLFKAVVSCDGKGRPKPHPDPYLRALGHAGVPAERAIAIEDSPVGCESARRAGLFVVGIPENGADIGAHAHYGSMPDADPELIVREVAND